MKKIICTICMVSFTAIKLYACDICGCGAGNSYIGILPDFNKKIFGVRYRYNLLRTHIGVGGATTYLTTNESYKTFELWTGWNIGKKFRTIITLPYNLNDRKTVASNTSKNGIGDFSVAGYYELLEKRNTVFTNKLLVQNLWIGISVKLPTGNYETVDKITSYQSANLFQLGTGSTDVGFNAMYDVRLNDWGLNIAGAYKINTANKFTYRYGNKFNVNTQLYYKFNIKNKIKIAPNAGIQYETSKNDVDKNTLIKLSGGNLLLGTAGMEIIFKKTAVGFNLQSPFSQNMAAGFIKAQSRGMLHISFIL